MRFLVVTLLAWLVSSAAAQSKLVLPQSADDVRKYMAAPDARCPGCGVVNNVRRLPAPGAGGAPSQEAEAMTQTTGDPGPGRDIQTVTILGTGSESRAARAKRAQPATGLWRITVRYDDGSYATFDQEDRPAMRKGDRIQVVAGRVERR